MIKHTNKTTVQVTRLGSANFDDRIKQSLAGARLEGLSPNHRTEAVIRDINNGKISTKTAVKNVLSWYARHA